MLFTETTWPADKVQAGNWSPVQWFDPRLAEAAEQIEALPGLRLAKEICPVSYMGRQFRATFDYEVGQGKRPNAFCTIAEDVMQTMEARPETEGRARKGRERQAEKAFTSGTRLLITSRFSTTSSRLLAIRAEQPAIGSSWYSMRAPSEEAEKAWTAFLNSTFGAIQMLNRRTKKLTYPSYEAGHIETLMLPDPGKIDTSGLAAAFEKCKNQPLAKLAECAADPVREALDKAAGNALGYEPDKWRALLTQEPTVKG